jgi:hypothetical protein
MLDNAGVTVISDAQAEDIDVSAALIWTTTHKLALQAHRSISIGAQISITGEGGLSLTINSGAADGVLSFTPDGHVAFSNLASKLTIDGDKYLLVNSIAGLQSAVATQISGKFALATPYDASRDGTYSSSPIAKFSGTFEGLGNAIAHLAVNDPAHGVNHVTGFFGAARGHAVVRDIRFTDVNLSGGNHLALGGIVAENYGTVLQSSVSGTLQSEGLEAGGIAGENYGKILNCDFSGNITGTGVLGGIVGINRYLNQWHGLVTSSRAVGSITGSGGGVVGINESTVSQSAASSTISYSGQNGIVGGLAGRNYGTISLSFATGAISLSASEGAAGGFVAQNLGAIERSYATGTVTADFWGAVGGFVGDNDLGFVSNSYAMGAVDGGAEKGGFAGEGGPVYASTIYTSYSTGNIGRAGQDWSVGGFIGFYGYPGTGSSVKSGYWDLNTSGYKRSCGDPQDKCKGMTGLSTTQFLSGIPRGFDSKVWAADPKINNGYPYLRALPPK